MWLTGVLCVLAAGAAAQSPAEESGKRNDAARRAAIAHEGRFDYTWRRNPWLDGANAAGIRQDSVSRSYAAVCLRKENGSLADPSASDDSWNAGASTRSIRHFDKVSFAGGFAYDYFDGRNMCGSMLTQPGYYPVDVLEFTPGRKVRETYAFTGAVATVLGKRWTGGLKADFMARNYAKRKDLRHKNTRLDFELSPGVMYRAGRLAVGAAYIVGVDREKLEAEEIGNTAESYKAFFDRGLRFGSLRLWQSNDLHLTTSGVSGFPLRQTTQGASLTLQCGPLFLDAAYRNRRGETGERGITWHEFLTDRVTVRGVLSLGRDGERHYVRAGARWESQSMDENILTVETVGGVATPQLHGSTPAFGRKSLDLHAEWEWAAQRTDLRAGVGYERMNRRSTLMYPQIEGQRLHCVTVHASLVQRLGFWELSAEAGYRKGAFDEYSRQYDSPSAPGAYPERLTEWYDRENEYLTADRLTAGLGLRRNIRRFWVEIAARWEHGFGLKYLAGADRVRAEIGAGYNF